MKVEEPEIVEYGRVALREGRYKISELRDSLVRAFKTMRADFIILDDNPRGQRFTSASVAWAIDGGLLYTSKTDSDGQCTVSAFRLTEKGRKEILS